MANSSFIYSVDEETPGLATPYLMGLRGIREVEWSILTDLGDDIGPAGKCQKTTPNLKVFFLFGVTNTEMIFPQELLCQRPMIWPGG